MIDSARLESNTDQHLQKFDDINNNHYQTENPLLDCENPMKETILSSTNQENDTNLLTTTTTTTVELKVKTSKTSSARKRKLNLINQINNDNHINKQAAITKKKKKSRMTKTDPDDDEKKKKNKTNDQSSVTDESSFGSCEPGTSVVLQGIVWNETDKGVLVVNITWRGKTYVGALLNTTEQNWAPPRYKSDIRSTKPNHQLTLIPPSHDSTERILRNGKRRGSSTTVTPSSTTKTRSFKIPETPVASKKSEISSDEKILIPSSTNLLDEDETGDNYSSRSVSPTTSGISTTSSSPPLSTNNENQSTSIPMDLSNSKSNDQQLKSNDPLIPYHFPNEMLFPSSDYFSSTNSFNLPSFNKLSSTSSNSSYLPITSQLYFNYPPVSSLSKSSH